MRSARPRIIMLRDIFKGPHLAAQFLLPLGHAHDQAAQLFLPVLEACACQEACHVSGVLRQEDSKRTRRCNLRADIW